MPVLGNNSTTIPVNIKTSSYTIDRQDGGEEIKFEITANATATLPEISNNQIGDGFNIFIRNNTTGSDTVTLATSGSDTIDGVTTLEKDEVVWLRGNGTEWQSMDQYADGAVTSVATGTGLTGGPITSTGTISIDDAGVTTAKIASNAVDGTKIAMGSDAQGDVLYYNGTDYVRLAAGTSGQVLKTNGASANPSWTDASSGGGKIVQVVNTQTGTFTTGTGTIPFDNTIPQNTEGDEFMSLSITPTNTANKLKVEVVFFFANNTSLNYTVALFQDSTSNALAAGFKQETANHAECVSFNHFMAAGTTSSTTFKVRAGGASAGTTSFNGHQGSAIYGGVIASSITITEIEV
tara:strand:- start:2636 stop:3685 length:1050 start_codon:yes stop_codon:yes gene_type:complete